MATSTNITFYFNNQTAYDLVSDGKLWPWGSESSGKWCTAPRRVDAGSAHVAFKACGDSDSATGVTGATNYWFVSAGKNLNSSKSNAKGVVQLYFSVAYPGNGSAAWSHHDPKFVIANYSGFSSDSHSINVNATYTMANTAQG